MTTTDVDGSGTITSGDITTTTRYNSEGRAIESRMPLSGGSDAGTTKTIYYQAGTGSGDSGCDSKPEWAGLMCRSYPAAAPDSGPTMPGSRTTACTYLLSPSTVVETSGAATRTTTTTYLADGRVASTGMTASGLTGSTSRPAITTDYDPATGLATKTSASGTDYIQTGYDNWGRATSYRNSLGETTTTSYVPAGSNGAGSVATVTDPKGTTTYGFGADASGQAERRNLPTSVAISGIGTFTGAYDADGALTVQVMPGGIRQDTIYDTAGEPIRLSYTGDVTNPATNATAPGVWLAWTQQNDVTGRVRREWTPTGTAYTDASQHANAFDRGYAYDKAGRLTTVYDRTNSSQNIPADPDDPWSLAAACTTRSYTINGNGNRTALVQYPAAGDGTCSSATTPTTNVSHYGGRFLRFTGRFTSFPVCTVATFIDYSRSGPGRPWHNDYYRRRRNLYYM